MGDGGCDASSRGRVAEAGSNIVVVLGSLRARGVSCKLDLGWGIRLPRLSCAGDLGTAEGNQPLLGACGLGLPQLSCGSLASFGFAHRVDKNLYGELRLHAGCCLCRFFVLKAFLGLPAVLVSRQVSFLAPCFGVFARRQSDRNMVFFHASHRRFACLHIAERLHAHALLCLRGRRVKPNDTDEDVLLSCGSARLSRQHQVHRARFRWHPGGDGAGLRDPTRGQSKDTLTIGGVGKRRGDLGGRAVRLLSLCDEHCAGQKSFPSCRQVP